MIIGFDFDNTLINYSNSFKHLARKKKIVPEENNKSKISIRNYLRQKNIEQEWTMLQGEVYGKNIMSAKMFDGVFEALSYITKKNYEIKIISHKTQYPYIGEKIDLRLSAKNWMNKNLLHNQEIKILEKNIFFENTIEKKIKKILDEKCDIFVDDLPEILNLLPERIKKILFSYSVNQNDYFKFTIMQSWNEFPNLINSQDE